MSKRVHLAAIELERLTLQLNMEYPDAENRVCEQFDVKADDVRQEYDRRIENV